MGHLRLEKQEHQGVEVWTNVPMEMLRRHQCLCLNCSRCPQECRIAANLLEVCKNNELALMVTRCPWFSEQPPLVEAL